MPKCEITRVCERAKSVKGLTSTLVLTCSLPPPTHPSPFPPASLSPSPYLWPKWHFSPSLGGTVFRVSNFTSSTSQTLAGSASEILGRYPLSGNNQGLCFSWRDREKGHLWGVLSNVYVGQGAAEHCAGVCERRHFCHLCQPPLILPLVWCTGLIFQASLMMISLLFYDWSIVCCQTLY